MSSETIAPNHEPSGTEYSTAWVAYALQATGVFGFVLGPLIGLVVSYVRRDAAQAGFVASHHRWLIRTFWWTLAWYLLCLAVILAGAWPIISEVIQEAIRSGGRAQEFSFGIAWESIFATVGALSPALSVNHARLEFDPFQLARQAEELPAQVLLVAGDSDWARGATERLAATLTESGRSVTLEIVPGAHEDPTWRAALDRVLSFLSSAWQSFNEAGIPPRSSIP